MMLMFDCSPGLGLHSGSFLDVFSPCVHMCISCISRAGPCRTLIELLNNNRTFFELFGTVPNLKSNVRFGHVRHLKFETHLYKASERNWRLTRLKGVAAVCRDERTSSQ